MPSLRQLCPVISASLGLPNVERWAEVLDANGHVSLEGAADEYEIAALLLAILAAPTPEQSSDALRAISASSFLDRPVLSR